MRTFTSRPLRRLLSSGLIALLVAASLTVLGSVSSQLPAAVAAPSNPTVTCFTPSAIFNTGYNGSGGVLADGAADANWEVTGPYGTIPGNNAHPTWANVGTATGWGIQTPPSGATWTSPLVGNAAVGAWAPSPFNNSQWVTQRGKTMQQTSPGASWYYRYNFTLDPAVNASTYALMLNFFADNSVAEVYVNGQAQSTYNTTLPQAATTNDPLYYTGYATGNPVPVNLNHNWVTGANSIVVQTYSAPTNEGFNVQASQTAACVTALNDTATVAAGASVNTAVRSNDSSSSGYPLAAPVTIVTPPSASAGTAVAQSNGTVTFTASPTFSGIATYVYQVCDTSTGQGSPLCAQATVTVTVHNVVHAVNDSATVVPGSSVSTNVTTNDTTADPTKTLTVTVSPGQQPAHGTATVGSDGKTVTYTPAVGYAGPDSYHYTVCDNSTPAVCDTATVNVASTYTIAATPYGMSTPQNTAIISPVTDYVTTTGAALDPTTVTPVTQPSHGTLAVSSNGALIYTPNPGYIGADSYRINVCDVSVPTHCATVTIPVTVGPNLVVATPDSRRVASGSTANVSVMSNDASMTGQPLNPNSVAIASAPLHGTMRVVSASNATARVPAGTIQYTPDPGYSGVDSFRYRVCDTSTPTEICSFALVTLSIPVPADLETESILASTGAQGVASLTGAAIFFMLAGITLILVRRRTSPKHRG